eukprot:1046012-Alexandrium_andersonii.AAC.1
MVLMSLGIAKGGAFPTGALYRPAPMPLRSLPELECRRRPKARVGDRSPPSGGWMGWGSQTKHASLCVVQSFSPQPFRPGLEGGREREGG